MRAKRDMARWYSRGFAPREVAFDASLVNFIHWNVISWLATGTQQCEAINVLLHRGCIVLRIPISVLIFEFFFYFTLRIFQKCCNSPLFLPFYLKIRTTTDVILQIIPNKSSGSFVSCVNWIFATACRRDTPSRAENVGNIDLQKRLTGALTALTAKEFQMRLYSWTAFINNWNFLLRSSKRKQQIHGNIMDF